MHNNNILNWKGAYLPIYLKDIERPEFKVAESIVGKINFSKNTRHFKIISDYGALE